MKSACFCSFVDQNYLDGFLALLKSIVLNSPSYMLPFIVLHDDLSPDSVRAIESIYPDISYKKVDKGPYKRFVRGDRGNYLVEKAYYILDAFLIDDFDTVITLDTDMIALGDLSELGRTEQPVACVRAFYDNPDRIKLNSGLLVLQREARGTATFEKLCELGRSGDYELDKHDQGILTAYLNGDYQQLDSRFNFVKRRIRGKAVPPRVALLHFTGPIKPWVGTEKGYEAAESLWHQVNLPVVALWSQVLENGGDQLDPKIRIPYWYRKLEAAPYKREEAVKFAAKAIQFGRFEFIEPALTRDTLTGTRLISNTLLYKGIAARVNGDYLAGEYWLRHEAFTDQKLEARRLTELAELLWVKGDLVEARRVVELARILEPVDRRVHKLAERIGVSFRLSQERADGITAAVPTLTHVAFYMTPNGNAGDYLVPASVRWAFEFPEQSLAWSPVHAHQSFGTGSVAEANASNGVIVGGGGLFIPDTATNHVSGWQWNVADDILDKIDVPLILFAVGYNVFYGGERFSDGFNLSLAKVVEKASFVGIRNHGSLSKLRARLPAALREKLVYQPCPTTVLRQLVPHLVPARDRSVAGTVGLNCAYDRKERRFGQSYKSFLSEMAHLVRGIQKVRELVYFAHAVVDEEFLIDLGRHEGIYLPCRRFYEMTPDQIVASYTEASLVIGMRGHASMIPFGCGTPIISLISHPKMRYFLEDTKLDRYGVEISEPGFGTRALIIAKDIMKDELAVSAEIDVAQKELWNLTRGNLLLCREILGLEMMAT